MIDLHSHTNESDGSLTAAELIGQAQAIGLEALGISDHDTFTGYDQAVPLARDAGIDLVCAIELSTKMHRPGKPKGRSIHVLGYFLSGPPPRDFRAWLTGIQEARRDRNRRLVQSLQSHGVDVTLEGVEAIGRTLAGRPHFAKILVQKGYVSNIQEAFDVYLDESAKAYVERDEPSFAEGVQRIAAAGGLPCLAHPLRLDKRKGSGVDDLIGGMVESGLRGIEVYYSEHSPGNVERFLGIAQRYGLAVTGGSDFHGDTKPGISLGTGVNGNLAIPRALLDTLREIR